MEEGGNKSDLEVFAVLGGVSGDNVLLTRI